VDGAPAPTRLYIGAREGCSQPFHLLQDGGAAAERERELFPQVWWPLGFPLKVGRLGLEGLVRLSHEGLAAPLNSCGPPWDSEPTGWPSDTILMISRTSLKLC
jgi:hypothetical protein